MTLTGFNDTATDSLVRWTVRAVVIVGVASAFASRLLSIRTSDWLFSPEGPFERISILLWIVLAIICLTWQHRSVVTSLAAAGLALFAAAREASLHIAFTDYSVLKIPFYYRSEHAVAERLIAGGLVALLGLCIIVVGHRLWFAMRRDPRPFAAWKMMAALAIGLVALTKLLDRLPNLIYDLTALSTHPDIRELARAVEESLEMMIPIVILVALIRHRGSPGPQSSAISDDEAKVARSHSTA